MLIIGAFEHSLDLELLLASLENKHIDRKYIMVVPMDIDPKNQVQFYNKKMDILHKGIEIGMACATLGAVIGASMGFVLTWGPVFWGLIDAVVGFSIGFSIYLSLKKFYRYRHLPEKQPEVTVIVQCQEEQSNLVADAMWEYCALSVGKK